MEPIRIKPLEVEKRIHSIIDRIDDTLHARERLENGRIRERDFFLISLETAYGIFKDVAALRNDSDNLKLYQSTQQESQEGKMPNPEQSVLITILNF